MRSPLTAEQSPWDRPESYCQCHPPRKVRRLLIHVTHRTYQERLQAILNLCCLHPSHSDRWSTFFARHRLRSPSHRTQAGHAQTAWIGMHRRHSSAPHPAVRVCRSSISATSRWCCLLKSATLRPEVYSRSAMKDLQDWMWMDSAPVSIRHSAGQSWAAAACVKAVGGEDNIRRDRTRPSKIP